MLGTYDLPHKTSKKQAEMPYAIRDKIKVTEEVRIIGNVLFIIVFTLNHLFIRSQQ